jgi:hypothetical protein
MEMVIGRYKKWIADSQEGSARLTASNEANANSSRAEISRLTRQKEEGESDRTQQEAKMKQEHDSSGYGGFVGCLTTLGVVIYAGIIFEFFATNGARGLTDIIGKLVLFSPLILILPIMIAKRSADFRRRKRDFGFAVETWGLDIESKITAIERSAREAERKGIEEVKRRTLELERLRPSYRNNIALLEKRLAIVMAS